MADFDWGTIYPDATAAADAAGGGAGGGGWWSNFTSGLGDVAKSVWDPVKSGISTLSSVAKEVQPLISIGSGIMGAVSGFQGAQQQQKMGQLQTQQIKQQAQNARDAASAAAPLRDFGLKELQGAEAGQVPAAIQTQVDLWKQGAIQKARDYLARTGQGDSEAMVNMENWIDQQAKAMTSQAILDMQHTGASALTSSAGAFSGAGASAGGAAASAGAESDSLTKLIAQANQQLAQLGAAAS